MNALMSEHAREKKALLARIADAEERAEAYSMKVVEEHRTKKQMVALKQQRRELALRKAVAALSSSDVRQLYKAFAKWHGIVKGAILKKQEFELEQREQWVARAIVEKEREAMNSRRDLRVNKLSVLLSSRHQTLAALKSKYFGRWRNQTHAFKAYVARARLGSVNVALLGQTLAHCKRTAVLTAFRTWRARTHEAQISRQNQILDCSRLIVKQLIKFDNDRKRAALSRWQAFVLSARVDDTKRLLARYAQETETTVATLNEGKRLAEETARRYEIEQQRTRIQAEKLRSEFMQKRDHLMHQAIFHLQLTRCGYSFLKWKRYTHSCIMKDMEQLQRSMKMFGGDS